MVWRRAWERIGESRGEDDGWSGALVAYSAKG